MRWHADALRELEQAAAALAETVAWMEWAELLARRAQGCAYWAAAYPFYGQAGEIVVAAQMAALTEAWGVAPACYIRPAPAPTPGPAAAVWRHLTACLLSWVVPNPGTLIYLQLPPAPRAEAQVNCQLLVQHGWQPRVFHTWDLPLIFRRPQLPTRYLTLATQVPAEGERDG